MTDLQITLIQSHLFWEDKEKNLDHFGKLLEQVDHSTDLVLFPEVFNTGFIMNPERYAEDAHGPSVQFLKDAAKRLETPIGGTLMIREDNRYLNRFMLYYPDGTCITYDKRHLFRLSNEFQYFAQGNQRVIFEIKGWRIMPLICYDLRFPIWSRNRLIDGKYEYDLMIYLANWPIVRSHVWKTLLMARAIENMSYVAGVNRIGEDGNGMGHSGDSMVVDPKGNVLYQAPEHQEVVHQIKLSAQDMQLYRESFAFSLDWDLDWATIPNS